MFIYIIMIIAVFFLNGNFFLNQGAGGTVDLPKLAQVSTVTNGHLVWKIEAFITITLCQTCMLTSLVILILASIQLLNVVIFRY